MKLFIKLFDSTRQKENIVVSFFDEQVSCLATFSLVRHVYNDQLICLILKSVELWNDFVSCYIGSWIVYTFLDSPEVIIIWFSQIEKQERCLVRNTQLFGCISNSRYGGHLTLGTLLRSLRLSVILHVVLSCLKQSHNRFTLVRHLVPHLGAVCIEIVNAFFVIGFFHQFGESGTLYSFMLFTLPLCDELITCRKSNIWFIFLRIILQSLTYHIYIFGGLTDISSQFGLNVSVLGSCGDLLLNILHGIIGLSQLLLRLLTFGSPMPFFRFPDFFSIFQKFKLNYNMQLFSNKRGFGVLGLGSGSGSGLG